MLEYDKDVDRWSGFVPFTSQEWYQENKDDLEQAAGELPEDIEVTGGRYVVEHSAIVKGDRLMKINTKYIFAFLILLITETIIALFVNDNIIRPYIGDVLVVILMYTLIRGLIQKSIKLLPVYLFLFASTVELAQYFHIDDMLYLQDNKLISTIIGTTFDITDIFCYLIATVILLIWNKVEKKE